MSTASDRISGADVSLPRAPGLPCDPARADTFVGAQMALDLHLTGHGTACASKAALHAVRDTIKAADDVIHLAQHLAEVSQNTGRPTRADLIRRDWMVDEIHPLRASEPDTVAAATARPHSRSGVSRALFHVALGVPAAAIILLMVPPTLDNGATTPVVKQTRIVWRSAMQASAPIDQPPVEEARTPAWQPVDAPAAARAVDNDLQLSIAREVSSAAPLISSPPPEAKPAREETARSTAARLDREQIAALVERAVALIGTGDIAAARLVLQGAAEARDAHAALLLAGTYDPTVLKQIGAHGLASDIAMARAWYEKAMEYGSAEAPRLLDMLATEERIDQHVRAARKESEEAGSQERRSGTTIRSR